MNISPYIDLERYQRVDRPIFEAEFASFLPARIYDVHVHLHIFENGRPTPEAILESWAAEAPQELSHWQLADVQRLLFPKRHVSSLVFANPSLWVQIDAANAHVAAAIAEGQAEGLLVVRPEWPAEHVRTLIKEGGFLGLKPYPGLLGSRFDENVSLNDFFPPAHQELANELGLIVMLHLPRPERLREPRNQAELRQLVQRYPRLRLIIAHIGRAYTISYAEPGLQAVGDLPVYWDFAMNLNTEVLARAMEIIGPDRLLYGSDLPVALMRGMRRHEGDHYINYSDGPYSWNTPARRQPPEIEAGYTFYLYEQLRAFKQAAERVGWGAAEIARVMHENAEALISAVKQELKAKI